MLRGRTCSNPSTRYGERTDLRALSKTGKGKRLVQAFAFVGVFLLQSKVVGFFSFFFFFFFFLSFSFLAVCQQMYTGEEAGLQGLCFQRI